MNKLILVMACDVPYLDRAQIYLETVSKFSRADENRFYVVGGESCKTRLPKITYKQLNHYNFKSTMAPLASIGSVQHGEFLDQDRFDPDDIIIFTDCDMRMQRSFSDEEIASFHALKQNEIYLARNASMTGVVPEDGDNLLREYSVLWPQVTFEKLAETLGEETSIGTFNCYNTGVIICRAATYKRLFCLYKPIYDLMYGCLTHRAVQQWVLCYVINKAFKVLPLATEIHAHGFGGLPIGSEIKDDIVCMNGKPVVFWHIK